MDTKTIVDLRRQAEQAVSDMGEGPLKVKAFEVILDRLMSAPETRGDSAPIKEPVRRGSFPQKPQGSSVASGSTTDRISSLKDEGFFQEQRTIAEVRETLASRGWHYPVTSLSGPLQALVQRSVLRRMKTKSGWKYSLP
jgi:hypothetical protein